MKRFAILLAVLLAACATPHGGEGSRSQASAKVHTELAALYYERAQLGVALDELRQALQAESSYAPAYGMRGLVHMALREDKEAEDDFRRSLQLDAENSETRNNYGWFLCQRGREREAVKQFLAALKNPLYATPEKAYLNAGLCSKKAGEMRDADEFLQKALLLRPGMPEAQLGLAELGFERGDNAAARSAFTQFAQAAGEGMTAENLWLGVRIERRVGDKNAEESYALQLRKRFPDARETQFLRQAP